MANYRVIYHDGMGGEDHLEHRSQVTSYKKKTLSGNTFVLSDGRSYFQYKQDQTGYGNRKLTKKRPDPEYTREEILERQRKSHGADKRFSIMNTKTGSVTRPGQQGFDKEYSNMVENLAKTLWWEPSIEAAKKAEKEIQELLAAGRNNEADALRKELHSFYKKYPQIKLEVKKG